LKSVSDEITAGDCYCAAGTYARVNEIGDRNLGKVMIGRRIYP
jgi:hypothetical protein